MRRRVQDGGQVADQQLLRWRQARRDVLARAIQDQARVDDLGVEAAKLGELGRSPELAGLPGVGLGQASVGVFGLNGADPGHGSATQSWPATLRRP